ncbi:MAG: PilZ domain-containing protein [Pseudomonadota bacterium]
MTRDYERRSETRQRESIRFVFNHAARRTAVSTSNVSKSGAFFVATSSFPAGTLLVLEFPEAIYECPGLRIMAKVAHARRGFPVKGKDAGMGVRWVRAFCAGGTEILARFLAEVLGFPPEVLGRVVENELGDAIFDFPAHRSPRRGRPEPAAAQPQAAPQPASPRDEAGHLRISAIQRGRFSVYAPVVFSIDNMHYQGRATSIGSDGLTIETVTGLPTQFCRVAVRYPLRTGRLGERVVLFGEVDLVVGAGPGEPGIFNVVLTGLDELDNPGAFRSFLRGLAKESQKT